MPETTGQQQEDESFGSVLDRLRIAQRLTKKELAERAGVSISYISLLTGGGRQAPSAATVAALAGSLNLDSEATDKFYRTAGLPPSYASAHNPNISSSQIDWPEAPDVKSFVGRRDELALIGRWMLDDRCRVVGIFGIGGVGKTSLVSKLASQVEGQFDHVIGRSLFFAPSLKDLLRDLLQTLPGQQNRALSGSVAELLPLLLTVLREHRCLLVLDNVESILNDGAGPEGELYKEYEQLFKRLGESSHQSCLLLTCREKPKAFVQMEVAQPAFRSFTLGGLNVQDVQRLMQSERLNGSDDDWGKFVDRCYGNPLALKIVAGRVRSLFAGNLHAYLGKDTALLGSIHDILDQEFMRLSDLERELLYWIAIEQEPASIERLQSRILHQVRQRELLDALDSLQRRSFTNQFDERSQGLIMPTGIAEYVLDQLVKHVVEEITTGRLGLLNSHALLLAQAKDYIRENQNRLIIKPIADELRATLRNDADIQALITRLLDQLRSQPDKEYSFAAGNLLHLLAHLGNRLVRGHDFSRLVIRQAYLQDVELHDVSFAFAHIKDSVFTETFGSVLCVAFSPDSKLLATGSIDGHVRLWEVGTRRQVLMLSGHTDWVRSIAFSPDGTRLASCGDDFTVCLWRLDSGACLWAKDKHRNRIWSLAFSPDGTQLVTSSEDRTVRVWNTQNGEEQYPLDMQGGPAWSLAFSPDGESIATGGDDGILRVWDLASGQIVHTLAGHAGAISSVAYNSDGRLLASAGADKIVRVWDSESAECIHELVGHTNQVVSIAFAPDGKSIASAGAGQTVRIWHLTSEKCDILFGHTSTVWSLAYSPNGAWIASSGDDQTVRLWDVGSHTCFSTIHGYSSAIWSVAINPKSAILASGSEDQIVRLWDTDSKQCLYELKGHTNRVRSVAFSSDGAFLASGSEDHTLRLWNASKGTFLDKLEGHLNPVRSVAFSPDGAFLASGSEDRTIRLWRMPGGDFITKLEGHEHKVWSVAFSRSSKQLVSGGQDNAVRVWAVDTMSRLRVLQGHTDRVMAVAFHPDGHTIASGGDDKTIRTWDVDSGEPIHLLHGHTASVLALAYSPDGRLLASAGHDRVVKLWDAHSGALLRTLEGHTMRVWSVVFSLDGEQLFSCGDDGTMRHWDVFTGKELDQPLQNVRPYEQTIITEVSGLTKPQLDTLKRLGATEKTNDVIE